ncbi:EI24 domain-containing protein [Rugosimonospora acidiphila]
MTGVGLLVRGLGTYARNPGLVVLGMLPALIAFALLLVALIALLVFLGPESRAVTWFANGWSDGLRDLLRVLAAITIVGVFALLAFVAFTGLTLAVGDPFYEKISERVEDALGGVPNAVEVPWWRGIFRGLAESIRLLVFSAVVGVLLFVGGLLPAVGQTVVPVIGALVGGWVLALELTGVAGARRGLRLRERRELLRRHRFLALGFGVSVFVCFLIPFGAILGMPAAVVGATLMTRRMHGLPIQAP